MALGNLGFETGVAGSPGLATSWTISVTSTAVEYAGYTAGTFQQAWDGFETGWGASGWSVGLGVTDPALYSVGVLSPAPTVERFEAGWNNAGWLTGLGSNAAAPYGVGALPREDFESQWSNDTWSTALGSTATAQYDTIPEGFEDFEEGWSTAAWSTALGSTAAAQYDAASEAFEDFEEVFAPVLVTADPSANTLTAPAHGIPNGTLVRFRSTGRTPGGINTALDYWVVNATTNTLQVAAVSGGSAIDIGDQGSGALSLLVDPTRYWNDILVD